MPFPTASRTLRVESLKHGSRLGNRKGGKREYTQNKERCAPRHPSTFIYSNIASSPPPPLFLSLSHHYFASFTRSRAPMLRNKNQKLGSIPRPPYKPAFHILLLWRLIIFQTRPIHPKSHAMKLQRPTFTARIKPIVNLFIQTLSFFTPSRLSSLNSGPVS